jgi:hypothetical protein
MHQHIIAVLVSTPLLCCTQVVRGGALAVVLLPLLVLLCVAAS